MLAHHQLMVIYMLIHILLLNGKVKRYVRCILKYLMYQLQYVDFIMCMDQVNLQKVLTVMYLVFLKDNIRMVNH